MKLLILLIVKLLFNGEKKKERKKKVVVCDVPCFTLSTRHENNAITLDYESVLLSAVISLCINANGSQL